MAAFEIFFVQEVFEKNHNFLYQGVKNQKKLSHICYVNFKTWYIKSVFIFLIFYSLAPKIVICLKKFLVKNSKNQP